MTGEERLVILLAAGATSALDSRFAINVEKAITNALFKLRQANHLAATDLRTARADANETVAELIDELGLGEVAKLYRRI